MSNKGRTRREEGREGERKGMIRVERGRRVRKEGKPEGRME